MTIHRTAAPGGVVNFLCYINHEGLPSPTEGVEPALTTPAESNFWQQLFTQGLAPWPAIESTSVRVAEVPDGCLFMVEDEQGLLLVGGVGLKKTGPAWEALSETVEEIREQAASAVQQSPGGKELMAHWKSQVVPPSEGDWVILVPMIGLRYYGPDAERIMHLAGGLGTDLLTIFNRKVFTT